MKVEIKREGKTMATYPGLPGKTTRDSMRHGGCRIYVDGKLYKEGEAK